MLGIFKKGPTLSYSGSSSHIHIDRLLREGREISIVSPYIDNYYAKIIRGMSRDRRFMIIASSIDPEARRSLGKGLPLLDLSVAFAAWLAVSCAFYYLLHSPAYLLGILLIFLIYVELKLLFFTGTRNIRLKVPRDFVHAKMYLSERQAIVGSANLTYKGTHRNVEHIEVTSDPGKVASLRKDFGRLWRKY